MICLLPQSWDLAAGLSESSLSGKDGEEVNGVMEVRAVLMKGKRQSLYHVRM